MAAVPSNLVPLHFKDLVFKEGPTESKPLKMDQAWAKPFWSFRRTKKEEIY